MAGRVITCGVGIAAASALNLTFMTAKPAPTRVASGYNFWGMPKDTYIYANTHTVEFTVYKPDCGCIRAIKISRPDVCVEYYERNDKQNTEYEWSQTLLKKSHNDKR